MNAVLSIQPWQLNNSQAPAQRLRLAQLWLAAPEDQLEMLWRSTIGEITRSFIRQLNLARNFRRKKLSFVIVLMNI